MSAVHISRYLLVNSKSEDYIENISELSQQYICPTCEAQPSQPCIFKDRIVSEIINNVQNTSSNQ